MLLVGSYQVQTALCATEKNPLGKNVATSMLIAQQKNIETSNKVSTEKLTQRKRCKGLLYGQKIIEKDAKK